MFSCEKEIIFEPDNDATIEFRGSKKRSKKLDERSLNDFESVELMASKILAFKLANDREFRLKFTESLFTENGYPREDVFLCNIIDEIDVNGQQIRNFLQSIDKTRDDFTLMANKMRDDYPLLVAKVPMWYGSIWSLTDEGTFSYDSPLLDDIRLIPFIENADKTNDYNTYKVDALAVENEIINSKEGQFDYVPVLIRKSEYHRIVDIQNLSDQFGNPILSDDQIDRDPHSEYNTINLLRQCRETPECSSISYSIVNWIKFQQELSKKPTGPGKIIENCYNGIDDDGDGLVDCDDVEDCPCTEICDNGIDDDGDDLIDQNDGDCCWFYAGCDRDCVAETNYFEGLRLVNNSVGQFHNHEPTFNDNIGIKIVTYEFVGPMGAVPNKKDFYYPFMKLCGLVSINTDITGELNSSYQAFYAAEWSQETIPPYYLGISVNVFGIIWHLNLNEPLVVEVNTKWKNNWDGTLLGDRVRTEFFYLSSDVVSTSQQNTHTTQSVTTIGVTFGGTASTGEDGFGANIGYSWESAETETVQNQFTVNIAPADRSLGTFDMNYCESNSVYNLLFACPEEGEILGLDLVNGTQYSTGAMEVWSSIHID